MLNIVQVGLGPLGQKVVRFAVERGALAVVGAVDPAPGKAGRDLGEVCDLGVLGVRVAPDLAGALAGQRPEVAVVTTVSGLKALVPQLEPIAAAGLHIVSTCEELSYPWETQPELAKRLDETCRRHGVACIGTGVNPGFLMDYLPCVLTSVCQHVERVCVSRVQDASKRRVPFQQKIGAGLSLADFERKATDGTLRHVGLTESMHLIARALNWKLDRIVESLDPVVAREEITSGYVRIAAGMACGVEQTGRGFMGAREAIRLQFRAAVGEKESYDTVEITGIPDLKSTIPGGVNGDVATCAITLNACRAIGRCTPGLKTMLDLPVPTYFQA